MYRHKNGTLGAFFPVFGTSVHFASCKSSAADAGEQRCRFEDILKFKEMGRLN